MDAAIKERAERLLRRRADAPSEVPQPAAAEPVAATAQRTHVHSDGACTHCGQPAWQAPRCWLCNKPMNDWPRDPAAFLLERGWEPAHVEGSWLEPEADWCGPVTDEMLASAANNLKGAQEYADFSFVKKDEGLLFDAQERAAQMTATHDALLAAKEAGQAVPRRSRGTWPETQACRKELNKAQPRPADRVVQRPLYTEEQVRARELEMLAIDRGVLGRGNSEILRDMRRKKADVHQVACTACCQF